MIGTMKTNLKKIFALSLISFALCGCNEGANVAILKVGFDKCIGTSSPTPQVGLAFTSKSKQSLNAAFDVYVGARKGFSEDWENDLWGCNPGYGKFAINREIKTEAGETFKNDYMIIDDFPNEEKYLLTYETIEGTVDGVIPHYSGYIEDTFDFSSIDLAKGKIGYHIVFYDDINQKLFDENVYLYGIYWVGTMNFEKVNEEVVLSI